MTPPPFRTVRFDAPRKGVHLLILGAVHGDEICGTQAIESFLPELSSGRWAIEAGSVTFVPVVNTLAFARGVRYVDHNLNRDLRRRQAPQDHEDHIANLLCPLLESCDVLLDLHAYAGQGPSFIWAGPEGAQEEAFRRRLGPDIELFGWAEAYARLTKTQAGLSGIGTTEYLRAHGGMGVTLECGPIGAPEAIGVAQSAIKGAMAFCGIAHPFEGEAPLFPLAQRVRLEHIFTRKGPAERFPRPFRHLDPVKKGEILALDGDIPALRAPQDGFVIFPRPEAPIGDEWLYFGIDALR